MVEGIQMTPYHAGQNHVESRSIRYDRDDRNAGCIRLATILVFAERKAEYVDEEKRFAITRDLCTAMWKICKFSYMYVFTRNSFI